MPELPEAEINRENLTAWLAGERLLAVAVPDPLIRRGLGERTIREAVENRIVRAVRRRGKFLRIELSPPGRPLWNHLGMSGKWARREAGEEDPPAVRASLHLAGERRVVFSDKRRFGFLTLCLPEGEARLARLGPEPLGPAFTGKRLAGILSASRRPVKALLMDQDRIAGIGNIQATEALWRAGIHPARSAAALAPEETKRLHRAIRATLRRSIRNARGPEILYLNDGAAGRASASARFLAYGRTGDRCASCRRAEIAEIRLAGRSSFFCPRCQPPARPDRAPPG